MGVGRGTLINVKRVSTCHTPFETYTVPVPSMENRIIKRFIKLLLIRSEIQNKLCWQTALQECKSIGTLTKTKQLKLTSVTPLA